MRIALTHDYLNQFGGAERVVLALSQIYPEAPLFTSIFDQNNMPEEFAGINIRTSFMQKLPLVFNFYRQYFFLYPFAFDAFDLTSYDCILSSSSAWAKGVRKAPGQVHICYCHSPMRFVWRYDDYVKQENWPRILKIILPYLLAPIKYWDLETAKTVDYFVANSRNVARRIRQVYGREAEVINPPVDCSKYYISNTDQDYFLVISRLTAYKRLDIVIKAFNQLELPLKIIGTGPAHPELKKISGPYIEFLGKVNEKELARLLSQCRALIFAGEEDFGITPLEAMASGRPVIAYRAGGALETILENETGLFFDEQTPEALIKSLKKFQFMAFDKQKIRKHSQRFDKSVFLAKIKEYIDFCLERRRHE